MIRVLLVDDSLMQLELLKHILSADPDIEVIDTAMDGEEAIKKVIQHKPDVVTMDIHMPKMNGIEATQKIMSTKPVPIIIICGCTDRSEISDTFRAFEAGAVSVTKKINFGTDEPKNFVDLLKTMSEVSVVRRIQNAPSKTKTHEKSLPKKNLPFENIKAIGIGVSTGGPIVLKEIFEKITEHFPPILVVQHISEGFITGMSDWLRDATHKEVKVAENEEKIERSCIYLAPDGYQMGVKNNKILLEKPTKSDGHCPSVNYLFNSMAETFGKEALGILLTGMGKDGATGLKHMHDLGAVTIAQDSDTSIIHGMPKEAVALNAATWILSPPEISEYINKHSIEK